MNIINNNFGINPSALSIMNLISSFNLEDDKYKHASFQTYPFYNGREKGICLVIQYKWEPECLFLSFGEHRNSDSLFLDSWKANNVFNGMTVDDFPEVAYKNRTFMNYNGHYDLANKIFNLAQEFLDDKIKE